MVMSSFIEAPRTDAPQCKEVTLIIQFMPIRILNDRQVDTRSALVALLWKAVDVLDWTCGVSAASQELYCVDAIVKYQNGCIYRILTGFEPFVCTLTAWTRVDRAVFPSWAKRPDCRKASCPSSA